MTDPIRAALERLVVRLQETTDPEGPVPAWSDSFYAARLALAAAPEGEVAELVAELRSTASGLESQSYPQTAALITRAADLLEQRHPKPVPVTERLPGPEDLDMEGTCWVWNATAYTWGLFRLDLTAHSHWLPAHALPLPAGEPKP